MPETLIVMVAALLVGSEVMVPETVEDKEVDVVGVTYNVVTAGEGEVESVDPPLVANGHELGVKEGETDGDPEGVVKGVVGMEDIERVMLGVRDNVSVPDPL